MIRPTLAVRSLAALVIATVIVSAEQESVGRSRDAMTLLAAGQFDAAETAARERLTALRAATGETPDAAAASEVLVEALIANGRAASEETLTLARQTLRLQEATLGSDQPSLAPSLINLGDALVAAGEFDQAIAASTRAVDLCDRASTAARSSDHLPQALDALGRALTSARRHDEALKVLRRSLLLKEQARPRSDPEVARTSESIALALQRQGLYAESGVVLRRAAAIQASIDPKHPAYVTTLNLLAQQVWFEGDLPASKAASEQATALAERTLRPGHPTLALSLRYLAATLFDLGDSTRSLELTRRSLSIAEQAYGPTHHVTAEYLNDLGFSELEEGNYLSARRLLQQARSIYEKRYGPWHEYVATSLNGLARADARLGDLTNATREQSRVIAIHERVGGRNHPFVAIALTELANVYLDRGMYEQALPLLNRALAIRERALGTEHRDVARTLADLSTALMRMGRPARAQPPAMRALRIWESLNAPDAPEYATILSLYARLQSNLGNHASARDYYQRALSIRARVLGPDSPMHAETESGLALALASLGDMSGALRSASSAETIGRDHLRLMLRSLPEREALNYAEARPRGLDLVLSLAGSLPEAATPAFDGLIRSRALVLDEIAARQSGRQPASGESEERRTLIAAQQRLANLMVRGPGQLSADQYTSLIDSARRESERAEQTLAEQSADFRSERSRAQVGLAEVTAALPADAALVSFARYQRTRFAGTPSTIRRIPSYVAVVIQRDRPPAVVSLGTVDTLDALIAQWRADIGADVIAQAQGEGGSSRESGVALRRRVWDPLTPHIGEAKRVFIVPDGALSLVPFAALPVGQQSYVLERGPVIHYLSAERDLVPLPRSPATHGGLLALGGPSFDDGALFRARPRPSSPAAANKTPATRGAGSQVCGGLQTVTFQPLTGTLGEVRDLSALWNTNAATKTESARVLVGHDANEARFKRDAPGSRVLHLATHGFFIDGSCASAPAGSRGVGGLARASSATPVDNPLLLSGLALAGANRRASAGPDEDDGILTAEEVASLNLEGVEWAVLSACDTGVGEIKAGEGVFGLRRAFQVAGARTVVMSLWSVDDQATRAWMRALYEGRFQKQLSTADAVHAATLAVLRARRASGQSTHPFYWAAFVAVGDWR